MKYRICSLAFGLLPLALLAGCDKKEEASVTTEAPTAEAPAPESTEATTESATEATTQTESTTTEAK